MFAKEGSYTKGMNAQINAKATAKVMATRNTSPIKEVEEFQDLSEDEDAKKTTKGGYNAEER